jgi:hydrogenase maturation protein HypF
LAVLDLVPAVVASDLHPDFHSTRFAADLSRRLGVPHVRVQHHHAHVAAVMAEHGIRDPVLGLALDGVGLGDDGAAWGGELLAVDAAGCRRIGHLRPLPLPGGDRAAREPWRMAAAALHVLGRGGEIEQRWPGQAGAAVRTLLDRGIRCPPTSSAGRWFDAAAGLLGVKPVARFEGQAAMLLEGLAAAHGPIDPLPNGHLVDDGNLDLTPLIAHLADCSDANLGAALFHSTLAQALVAWAGPAASRQGLRRIVLSGGCFMNRILSGLVGAKLRAAGFEVLEARELPPNDGGIAAGQAWVVLLAQGES